MVLTESAKMIRCLLYVYVCVIFNFEVLKLKVKEYCLKTSQYKTILVT